MSLSAPPPCVLTLQLPEENTVGDEMESGYDVAARVVLCSSGRRGLHFPAIPKTETDRTAWCERGGAYEENREQVVIHSS